MNKFITFFLAFTVTTFSLCSASCNSCTGTNCASCNPGFYFSLNQCNPCTNNCQNCNSSSCILCSNGYVLSNTSCLQCPNSCQSCSNNTCICASGTYLSNNNCNSCIANCFSCNTGSDCNYCADGFTLTYNETKIPSCLSNQSTYTIFLIVSIITTFFMVIFLGYCLYRMRYPSRR